MGTFHMQIWLLCKLFKYVVESLGSDAETFPCLCISVKGATLITEEFIRVKVLPTGLKLGCGMEKMRLYHPMILCYPLKSPPPDSRKRRQCLGLGCTRSTINLCPELHVANWRSLNPGNVETDVNASQHPKGKFCSLHIWNVRRKVNYRKVYDLFCCWFFSWLFPNHIKLYFI